MIAVAALNSLLESGGTGNNQTLRWTLRLRRAGAPELRLSDVVASESPSTDLVAAVSSPLRFLFNNPFDHLELDSVAVDVQVEPQRELWTLRSAEIQGASVRPGGTVTVRCEVERWRGDRETHTLRVPVPEEFPDGRYVLWLGGGSELTRYESERLPARYRPISLDEAWRRMAEIRTSNRLYGALVAKAPEVTAGMLDYPELPTSALAVLASGTDRRLPLAARRPRRFRSNASSSTCVRG